MRVTCQPVRNLRGKILELALDYLRSIPALTSARSKNNAGSSDPLMQVRRIKSVLADPGSRILVFSDWAEVLELVAHAASANAIPCLHVKNRKNMPKMLALFQGSSGENFQPDSTSLCGGVHWSQVYPS